MDKKIKYLLLLLSAALLLGGLNYLLHLNPTPEGTTNTTGCTASQLQGRSDIAQSPYFAAPDIFNFTSNEHLTILSHFKTRQQSTGYTCAPIAAAMVVEHFLGKLPHDEMEMASIMQTNNINGTTIRGLANYFQQLGWQVSSSVDSNTPKDFSSFKDFVLENLQNNTPIIIENIEWGGHYRVIIGYDTMGTSYLGDDVIILADSFDLADHVQDGYNIENAQKLYYMWFDAQLFSRSEQRNPWLTARPQ